MAILFLGFTTGIASALCPAVTFAPTTVSVSNGNPSRWQSNSNEFPIATPTDRSRTTSSSSSRSSSRSLHVLQSARIIPCVFRSVGVGLAYKAFRLQAQSKHTIMDAVVLFMTGLMSFFNFATKDNDRLTSAKRAVQRFEKHSADELTNDAKAVAAANTYKSAVRVKIFYQFLSLVCMGLAKTRPELYVAAGAVVGSTLVFLILGGGRFRHNASGRLDPAPDDFIAKAYRLDLSILVAAAGAALVKTPPVLKNICAGYVAFGYFGAAMEGMAPKSRAKQELNKAVFGKSTPAPSAASDNESTKSEKTGE